MDKDLDAGLSPAKELHRHSRGLPALDSILQDLRYTFRTISLPAQRRNKPLGEHPRHHRPTEAR